MDKANTSTHIPRYFEEYLALVTGITPSGYLTIDGERFSSIPSYTSDQISDADRDRYRKEYNALKYGEANEDSTHRS